VDSGIERCGEPAKQGDGRLLQIDFCQYDMYAAVSYIRAATRAGVPVRQACPALDELPGHPVP
jgi:hypothetical protein